MSLKKVHLFFILVAIIGADLVGAWSVRQFSETGNFGMLLMGILLIVGGLGLIWYAWRFVRKMDDMHIA